MFKKYIRNIVKEEINDIKLENTWKQSISKTYWEEHFKAQLKHTELLVKGRDKEISRLKEVIENLEEENAELKHQVLSNDYYDIVQENKKLKKENEILERSYNFISNNTLPDLESRITSKERIATGINLMLNKEKRKTEELEKELAKQKLNGMYGKNEQELKQENKKLKKELLDSKNGLNGANHVIKNNKEWINQQDKKIKELEEEIRFFKSDKEDLQYNLRRKSTKYVQLESKNKVLEEKLTKISSAINPVRNASFYGLMCTIDTIRSIIKES